MKKHILCTIIVLSFTLHLQSAFGKEFDLAQFTNLRMEYAKSDNYSPNWENNEKREKIFKLLQNEKIDEALETSYEWLKQYPFDAEIHLLCSFILRDRSQFKESINHEFAARGLIASIASSGDGTSLESPFKVISVGEEYVLLRSLGAKVKKQSVLSSPSGIMCDMMECEIKGKKVVFYFDVSISMAAINKMLLKK
jgi:hypothetical protein